MGLRNQKKLRFLFGLIFCGVALIGIIAFGRTYFYKSSPRFVLENSDELILYSLNPYIEEMKASSPYFHHNEIMGQKRIVNRAERTRLVNSLYQGMTHSAPQYSCFSPEHGLRATRGGRTVDVVICFGCGNVDFYENGRRDGHFPIEKSPLKVFQQAVLNAHLRHF